MKNHIIINFSKFFKEKETQFNSIIHGKKSEYKEFIIKFKKEVDNTKEAKDILMKYSLGKEINENELLFFKKQVVEVFKSVGIGIPIILIPGGIILLTFIIWLSNKYDIDILPSYLKKDKDQ